VVHIEIGSLFKGFIQHSGVGYSPECKVPNCLPQMAVPDEMPGSHIVEEMVGVDLPLACLPACWAVIGEAQAFPVQASLKGSTKGMFGRRRVFDQAEGDVVVDISAR